MVAETMPRPPRASGRRVVVALRALGGVAPEVHRDPIEAGCRQRARRREDLIGDGLPALALFDSGCAGLPSVGHDPTDARGGRSGAVNGQLKKPRAARALDEVVEVARASGWALETKGPCASAKIASGRPCPAQASSGR